MFLIIVLFFRDVPHSPEHVPVPAVSAPFETSTFASLSKAQKLISDTIIGIWSFTTFFVAGPGIQKYRYQYDNPIYEVRR